MDIKEYLLTDTSLNKSELAKLIWPNMRFADTHLQQILNGTRAFTKEDAKQAADVLKRLAVQLNRLGMEGNYPNPREFSC